MTIGLVIVTHNAEAFIRRALDAVAAQTRPPSEVVIIDNASRDDTWRVVQDATREWTVPVRFVAAGSNLGFAAANNRAVGDLSSPDLVALLNPDAFPEPGWLAALADAADAHPEAGSFASRLMLDGRPGTLDGAGDVCHTSGLVWRAAHGRRLSEVPEASRSGPVFSACAAAALYRRTDWVKAGGFDERFFCYTEDVDLGFRLQLAGRACWYQADAVVHHLGSASAVAGSAFSVYHGHRNLEWLFLKNMPASLFWAISPAASRYVDCRGRLVCLARTWRQLHEGQAGCGGGPSSCVARPSSRAVVADDLSGPGPWTPRSHVALDAFHHETALTASHSSAGCRHPVHLSTSITFSSSSRSARCRSRRLEGTALIQCPPNIWSTSASDRCRRC